MRARLVLAIVAVSALASAGGCTCGAIPFPFAEAPHPRFHPVPTRPTFENRHAPAAPWPLLAPAEPLPLEMREPNRFEPQPRALPEVSTPPSSRRPLLATEE